MPSRTGPRGVGVRRTRTERETVRIRFDEAAGRRGSFGRLLVYVVDDGVSFNHRLLERGHARVFDGAFSESTRFYRAESAARETRTGVWSCRDTEETDGETPAGSSEVVRTDPLRSFDGPGHAGGVIDATRTGLHATDTRSLTR
jgi:Micrococcal nuclease (thermonuclease) homologs